jgi:hypothetical protein
MLAQYSKLKDQAIRDSRNVTKMKAVTAKLDQISLNTTAGAIQINETPMYISTTRRITLYSQEFDIWHSSSTVIRKNKITTIIKPHLKHIMKDSIMDYSYMALFDKLTVSFGLYADGAVLDVSIVDSSKNGVTPYIFDWRWNYLEGKGKITAPDGSDIVNLHPTTNNVYASLFRIDMGKPIKDPLVMNSAGNEVSCINEIHPTKSTHKLNIRQRSSVSSFKIKFQKAQEVKNMELIFGIKYLIYDQYSINPFAAFYQHFKMKIDKLSLEANPQKSVDADYVPKGHKEPEDNNALQEAFKQPDHAMLSKIIPTGYLVGSEILRNQIRTMYDGYLTVLGDPTIKPWDKVIIFDAKTNMKGVCVARQVVQVFSIEEGFYTMIKPMAVASSRTYDDLAGSTMLYNIAAQAYVGLVALSVVGAGAIALTGATAMSVVAPIIGFAIGSAGGAGLGSYLMNVMGANTLGMKSVSVTPLLLAEKPFGAHLDKFSSQDALTWFKDTWERAADLPNIIVNRIIAPVSGVVTD